MARAASTSSSSRMSRSPKVPDLGLFAALMREAKPLVRKARAARPVPLALSKPAKEQARSASPPLPAPRSVGRDPSPALPPPNP